MGATKKILKYLPILIISLLALSLSIYWLIFIYQKTFDYAKDYLVQQANSVDKSLNKWFDERNADIRFILQSKELRNFLFPPNDKARLANEKVLKEIVAPIAKSHKYQNFWILDHNAQTLFSLNSGEEVPQKLIDGRDLKVLVKSPSTKTVQSFVEIALPDETKATLLLGVNKIFQNNDSTKFFSFISLFNLDDIF